MDVEGMVIRVPLGGVERQHRAPPPMPQPDAAAETLLERWAELNVRHDLHPGMLVIHKKGLDTRPREMMNQPMLLVEFDAAEAYPSDGLRFGRGDAVVFLLSQDGTAVPILTDCRYLEPFPRAGGDVDLSKDDD